MTSAHVGAMSSSTCFPSLPRLLRPSFTKTKSSPKFSMSMSKDPVREWILSDGKAMEITKISPVGGGCINLASRYDTDAGSFFVKTNRSIGPSMFEAEALGLGAMYETGTIRVPKPYKVGPLPTGGSFIIMEFIQFGASRGYQSDLGRKLAEMHKAGKSSKGFGFDVDNTIGSTPQVNTWSSDWVQFYGEHRLGYQLKLALDQYGDRTIYDKAVHHIFVDGILNKISSDNFLFSHSSWWSNHRTSVFKSLTGGQRLVKSMTPLFANVVIEPCLLHGDLWSGNISSDKNGEPVILDPACYYGHSEAEFGMSWCAGFGGSFYNSYFEVMPKQPGFEERRDLYMLYHYLNHYNLFGSGYRSSAMSIIDDYLAILKA
ncbi:Protein-ribulosamine 3-kinase, chloroplastic [Glycine max]|nr:Protein-ribulosamine 3-kinase, chloroplastic [Glycine max]